MGPNLQIGQVAKKLGLNPKTIRYYEEIGLLPPPKRKESGYASRGYRLFSEKDIERLEFIKQAKSLDMSLGQIKELLTSVEEGCCASARPQLKSFLERKLQEIDERLRSLKHLRNFLKDRYQEVSQEIEKSRVVPTCSPVLNDSECAFVKFPAKGTDQGG